MDLNLEKLSFDTLELVDGGYFAMVLDQAADDCDEMCVAGTSAKKADGVKR